MNSKTILITGVTRGLGRAMTDEFIRLGHRVHGCGRSVPAIAELVRRYHGAGTFTSLDVADDNQVAAWAKSVLATGEVPDLLLNNAALINPNQPLWNVSAEEFSRVMDVNVKGTANVIRRFVPAMIERGSGVVVNFSSGWGRSTDRDVAPYCATKWAIEGLTRSLAQELPRGLAAVPLNPGIIDTDMLRSCFGAGAVGFPEPSAWVRTAVPYLLSLGPKDNGRPLTVPGN